MLNILDRDVPFLWRIIKHFQSTGAVGVKDYGNGAIAFVGGNPSQFNIDDAAEIVGCHRNTASKRLHSLRECGYMLKHGRYWYLPTIAMEKSGAIERHAAVIARRNPGMTKFYKSENV